MISQPPICVSVSVCAGGTRLLLTTRRCCQWPLRTLCPGTTWATLTWVSGTLLSSMCSAVGGWRDNVCGILTELPGRVLLRRCTVIGGVCNSFAAFQAHTYVLN